MIAELDQAPDDESGRDGACGRYTRSGPVDPDTGEAKLLGLFNVPLQIVTDHPGFTRRHRQPGQRHLVDALVGFPEAQLSFDQDQVEQWLQPEPRNLLALHIRGTIGDQRQSTPPFPQPRQHWDCAGKQHRSFVTALVVALCNLIGETVRVAADIDERGPGDVPSGGAQVKTSVAMAHRVGPRNLWISASTACTSTPGGQHPQATAQQSATALPSTMVSSKSTSTARGSVRMAEFDRPLASITT
jgi:hypothetical protein